MVHQRNTGKHSSGMILAIAFSQISYYQKGKIVFKNSCLQIDSKLCDCMTTETGEAGKAIDGTTFYTSKSHVKFQLDAHYFRDGTLKAECQAIYSKAGISLKTSVQSNIKAGIGLRQYAADLFSSSSKVNLSKYPGTQIVLYFIFTQWFLYVYRFS